MLVLMDDCLVYSLHKTYITPLIIQIITPYILFLIYLFDLSIFYPIHTIYDQKIPPIKISNIR